jgi:hypothetical protein
LILCPCLFQVFFLARYEIPQALRSGCKCAIFVHWTNHTWN